MDYNNFYENRPPALTKSELVERIALLETLLAARSRCSIDFGDCMPDGHLPTNGDKRTYSECSCDDLEDDEKEFSEANESPVRDIPLRSVSTPPVYTSFFHKIMDNAKSMLSLRYNNKNATECQCDSSKVVNGDEESKSSSDSSMTYPAYTLTSSRVDTHKSSGESSSPTGKIPGKHISFEFDNTDNRVASREIFSYPSRNPQNLGCTCSLCKTCLPSTSSANENCATSVETTIDSDDSSSSSMEGQQQLIPKVFKISSHIEPTFSKMSVQSQSKKALHYCEHQPNRENQQHRGISTEVKVNEIALQNNPRVCETSTDPPSKKLYVKNAGVNFNPDELKIMTDTSMNHELQRHHVGVYFNPDEDLRMDGDSSRVKGAPQHHVGVYFNPDEDKMEGDTSKSLKKTMEAMMSTPDEHIRQLAVQQTHITNYMYPSVHYKHPHAANHQSHSEHCAESQRNASNVVNTVASDDKYLRPEHVNTTRHRRTQERRSVDYTQGSQQSNNSATSAVVTGFSLNDDLQQNEKFSQRIDEIEEVVQVLTATVAHSKKTCPKHSSRSVERSASKPEIIGNSTQTVGRRRSVSRANVAVRNENVPRRRRRSSCSPSVRRNSQSFSSSIELGNFQPDSINHANDNSETSYTRDHSTIAPLPPKKIFKETVYSFRTRNPEITSYCTMETCENKNVRTTGITNCSTNRAIYAPNYENGNNGCLSQGQGLSNRAIYAPNSENGNNICSSQGQGLTNGANYALNFENGNNGCSNQAQALADKNGSSTCKAVCATGYNVNTRYSFLRDNEANSPTNALAVPTNVDQKRSGCCPSACCPCSKSNIPDDFTKISQDLKLENVLLRNDLEDMKLELKQTLETLQGPMQHKLLEEQVKCLKLEEELEQTQKTMEAKEKDSNKEMQELRMELYCTTNNIDQLNEHNEKLKCELSNLSKMCAKLEEDLVKQKVMEADTIRLLTKKCQDEAVQKKSPCPPSKAKVSDTSDNMCEENLHVIARKLSETLKQCEPCEECAFFPPELSQAAKCIKNLTDMVDMHRVETECSQEEEPVRQPKPSPKRKKREKGEKKCNCTRKKKKSKHDGDRRDSECEKIDEATMKKEANTIACQCDLTQAKAKNCDETTETVAEIKIKYEVTDEIPGDVVEDKLEKEQEPGRPASCQCDLGLSEGVQVVELSNTKSGDEEDFQQCLDKCCTCSTENIKNDTTIREPPTETLSVSTSGPTSCYCSTQTSTGNTTYERIFSEQQPGFNSTLISTGTYNREQQVDVEVRAQFEYQDVAPITGTNDQTTVYFREPNSTINQDRPLGVFDKPTGFPFNVETEIDENVEPPTNFNVTTTVVDNGTIEVITEGATGVVETTLVYTPSGNIEVVTEILDDGPSVLPQSTFREDTPTTRGMMPEGTPTPMWVRPGDTQRGDKPCFCVKPVMNLPPPPPPPVYENTQMMQKPKDCTCKVPVTSMEPPPTTYRALPPERSTDRPKGCFCVKPESSIFPPAIEEKPKPEDVCSCPKQPEKIVNDPIKCTCVCTCSDPNGRYPDTCLAKETCGYRPKVEEGDVPPSEKPPRTCPANPKKICKCGGEPELPCDKLKKPSEMPKGEEQIVGEPREKEGFEFEETEAELGMKMELVYEQEIKEEKEEGEEEKPELEEGLGGIPLTEKESVYETAPEKFEEEYEEAMEGKGEEEMGDESVLKEHDFEKEGPPTEGESMIKEEGGEPGVTESKLGDKASRMTKEGEPIESDEGLTPKEEGEDLEETLILKGKESEMQKYEAEETLTAEEKELGIAKESSPVGSKEGSVTEKKEGLLSEEALKKSTEDAGKTSEEGVDVQKELSEEPIMKEPSEVKEELEVEGEPTEVTKEPSEVKDGLPPEVEESTELQREPSEVKKESSEVKKESSEVKKESSEVKKESAEIVEPSEAKKESVDAIEEPKKISEESIGKVETEVAGVDYEKLQKDKVSSEEGVCVCADQYPRESKIKKEQEAAEDEEAKRLAAEAERLAAEEAEHLAKEEADRLAAEETERLAAEEAERLAADEETDRLAKEEAELLAAEEAERLTAEEAERLAKEEADRLAAEEAERLAKEEAEHAAAEETTDAEDETHPLTEGDETTPLTTEEDEEGLEVVKEEDTQLLSAEGDEGEEEEGVRFPKDEVDELLAQLDEMEVEDYDMYLDELSELEDEMETAEEGEGDLGPKESEITEDYPPTDESGNVTPYSGVSTEMSSHYSEYREEHEYGDVICPTKTTCQSTVVKAQQDSTCQSTDKVDRSNQCNECRNVGVSTLASSETATEMVGSIGHDTLLGLTHEQLRELLKCPGIGALLETDTSKSKIKSETSFPTENDLENSELKELLEEIKEDIENAKTDRSIIDELDYSGHSRTSTCPGTKRGTCPIEICPGVLQQKIIERDSMVASSKRSLTIKDPPEVKVEPTRKRKCECPRTKPPTISHSETPKRRNEVGNIERRTLSETGKKKCTTFKETENFVNTAANLDRTEGDLSSPCCSCKKESPRAHPPECDCTKCICAPCHDPKILAQVQAELNKCKKPCAANLARERRMKAQRQAKVHMPNCTCVDCICMPTIKKLATTVEPPLPSKTPVYQVLTVSCACDKKNPKVPPQPPEPPPSPNSCYCGNCKCAPCKDKKKRKAAASGGKCTCEPCKCSPCKDPSKGMGCDCNPCECEDCKQLMIEEPEPEPPTLCTCGPCECKPICPIKSPRTRPGAKKEDADEPAPPAHPKTCTCIKCLCEECVDMILPQVGGKKREPIKLDDKGHPDGCDCDECACPSALVPVHPIDCTCGDCTCQGINEFQKIAAGIHPDDCDCTLCACVNLLEFQKEHAASCDCPECECSPCVYNMRKTIGCTCSICSCDDCTDLAKKKEKCTCETCKCAPSSDEKPPCICEDCNCSPDNMCDPNETELEAACDCEPTCACVDCADPNVQKKEETCDCTECHCESDASKSKEPKEAEENKEGKGKGCSCDVCKCDDGDTSAAACGTPGCTCPVCECLKAIVAAKNDVKNGVCGDPNCICTICDCLPGGTKGTDQLDAQTPDVDCNCEICQCETEPTTDQKKGDKAPDSTECDCALCICNKVCDNKDCDCTTCECSDGLGSGDKDQVKVAKEPEPSSVCKPPEPETIQSSEVQCDCDNCVCSREGGGDNTTLSKLSKNTVDLNQITPGDLFKCSCEICKCEEERLKAEKNKEGGPCPNCKCNPCQCEFASAKSFIEKSDTAGPCPNCACSPCQCEGADKKTSQTGKGPCPNCSCSPCKCESTKGDDKKAESQTGKGPCPNCSCSPCKCESTKGDEKKAQIGKGPCPNCACSPCQCESTKGDEKKAGKGPCPNCACSPCQCESTKGDEKKGGKGPCPNCACSPCQCESSQSKTEASKPEKGPCPGCVCKPCKCENKKEETKKADSKTEKGPCPNCTCPACKCESPKTETNKPDGAPCPGCTCSPCECEKDKKADSGAGKGPCPNCSCSPCQCEPTKGADKAGPCPDCKCSPCECEPQSKTDTGKSDKGACPECTCSPCECESSQSKTDAGKSDKGACPGCTCSPCECEKDKKGDSGAGKGPCPDCSCSKCECGTAKGDDKKAGKGPCPECSCSQCDCESTKTKTETSKSDKSSCPACICASCKCEEKTTTDVSTSEKTAAQQCQCDKCNCPNCTAMPGGKPDAGKAEKGPCPNCTCSPCKCENKNDKEKSDEPPPFEVPVRKECECEQCDCAECKNNPTTKGPASKCETKSDAPPAVTSDKGPCAACVCKICKCKEVDKKDGNTDGKTGAGPCPNCTCSPCKCEANSGDKGPCPNCTCSHCKCQTTQSESAAAKSGAGPCPDCKCDPCKCENAQSGGAEAKSDKGPCPNCTCSPCKCETTQSGAAKSEAGPCPDCKCAPCKCAPQSGGTDKKGPCPDCTCSACKCETGKTEGAAKSTKGPCPNCQCSPCKCKDDKSDSTAPPFEVPVRKDCECEKCDCFICSTQPKSKTVNTDSVTGKCSCDDCKTKGSVRNITVSTSSKQCDDISQYDNKTLKQKISQSKKECCQCRQEIEEIRKALDNIRCACSEAESKALQSQPFVKQASNFGDTMSGLKMALTNLEEKCKAKDRMIEAMTGELKCRAGDSYVDNLLTKKSDCKDVPDYDKTNGTSLNDSSKCKSKKRERKGSKAGADISKFEVTDIRRITNDSIILKWSSAGSSKIVGYDIFVNGVLKSKVMSGDRTSAMIHSLNLTATIQITIYAVTKCGRNEPPAIAIYEICK